ncbi:unnamed protein product, partial [marine sediment metagenome]
MRQVGGTQAYNWVIHTDDIFEFGDLPEWTDSAADVKLKLQLYRDDGPNDYSVSKIYVKDWTSGWDLLEELGDSTKGSWQTRTFSLSSEHISYDDRVQIRVYSNSADLEFRDDCSIDVKLDYLFLDLHRYTDPDCYVGYNFANSGDYYVYAGGNTNGFSSQFYINDLLKHTFGSSYSEYSSAFISDMTSLKSFLADDSVFDPSGNTLYMDYLQLLSVSTPLDASVYNEPVFINSSFISRTQDNSIQKSQVFHDGYLGRNTIQFTLKNSIQTPIFGRSNGEIYADLELSDLDLDFEIYDEPSYPPSSFPLENEDIEGKDTIKYNPSVLKDYTLYASSRFRHSAMDDIQIPLISPIELDFGSINLEDFTDIDLELALNLDITRNFTKYNSDWSLRFRLVYYNY